MKKSILSLLRNAALTFGLLLTANANAGFRISQPSADVRQQALMSLQDVGPVGDEDIQSTTGEEPFSVDFTALGIANPLDAYVLLVNEETGNAVELSADNDVEGKLTIPPLAMAELEMQYLGASPFYRCMVVACAETDLDDDEIVDLTAVETSIGAVEMPNFNYMNENGEVSLTSTADRNLVSVSKSSKTYSVLDPSDPAQQDVIRRLMQEESYDVYTYQLPDGTLYFYNEETKTRIDVEPESVTLGDLNFSVTIIGADKVRNASEDQVKKAVTYACGIWSKAVRGSCPITVQITFTEGSNFRDYHTLADSASPPVVLSGGVFYPSTIYNQMAGQDAFPNNSDVTLRFNVNYTDATWCRNTYGMDCTYYFGIDKNPGFYQQDFVTVLLHEIAHGMGFAGNVFYSSEQSYSAYSGSFYYGPGDGYVYFGTDYDYPNVFSRYLSYNGTRLTSMTWANRAAAVTSGNLYWDGPNVKQLNNGNRVKLYAPTTWAPGSSVSHWDDSVMNSYDVFMTWQHHYALHEIAPLEKMMMKDLGWTIPGPDDPSPVPPTPTGVSATKGTYDGKVVISWSSSSGAVRYGVWRQPTSSSSSIYSLLSSSVSSCSYTDSSVSGTTHYRYIVAAFNSAGERSGYSTPVEGYAKLSDIRTLSSVEVGGPASLSAGSYANYTCTAYYSDGTHADVSTSSGCTWSVPYGATYVDQTGRKVTAHSLTSSQTFTIRAQYTENGVSKSNQKTVTITPQPITYTISYGLNGGTAGSSMPASASYGTSFYVSAPRKAGSTFTGWTVTSGLNSSTAKWGTTSSPSTSISGSSTKCVNGASGNVYFINLRNTSGSVTLTANWSSAPITDNDHLANAAVISGISGHTSGSTVGATRESREKLPRAQENVCGSIWYSWTAPISGEVTFSTEGSSFDTVLAVYTGGSTHDSLTEFVSDDDGGENRTSIVRFRAIAGTTYKISIAGWKTNTGSVSLRWNMDDKVYLFVKRLYNYCLNRDPDESGGANWTARLKSGARDGISAAYGFCLSAEMKRRNLSNAQYVDILYRAMMDRASDANGKAYWVNLLDNGVSRAGVFCGFAKSAEFARICSSYGIVCGTINPDWLEERDKNYGVTMFVARCYTKALNRDYDVKGLNSWCAKINSSSTKKATAIQVAKSFLNSNEFKRRNLSNSAYVDVMYRTFFDRNPDTNGKRKWLGQLDSGVSRDKVMASFYNSNEFATIMAGYGIR